LTVWSGAISLGIGPFLLAHMLQADTNLWHHSTGLASKNAPLVNSLFSPSQGVVQQHHYPHIRNFLPRLLRDHKLQWWVRILMILEEC
jgi:hypothetical protein